MIKLNIGAGNKPLPSSDGWINIDLHIDDAYKNDPDYDFIVTDATTLEDIELGSVSEILASHIIEHIHPSKVMKTLLRWRGVLVPGGKLALEQPDIIKCCINVLQMHTSQDSKLVMNNGLWGLYGNSSTEGDGMAHQWGYSPVSLRALLEECGYVQVEEAEPQVKPWGARIRDFRLEAYKAEE